MKRDDECVVKLNLVAFYITVIKCSVYSDCFIVTNYINTYVLPEHILDS